MNNVSSVLSFLQQAVIFSESDHTIGSCPEATDGLGFVLDCAINALRFEVCWREAPPEKGAQS